MSWDLGDDSFSLGVQLNGKRFSINVDRSNFHNSPLATAEFNRHFDLLLSGDDETDELWEYLDWIIDPYLPEFERLAPPVVHSGALTLAHLASRQIFECQIDVIDEKFIIGLISIVVYDGQEDFDIRSLKTKFSLFNPSEVEIPYENPSGIFSVIPQRVFVHGQVLFWKSSLSSEDTLKEIDKYGKIAASGLTLEQLRTPRLYGIVAESRIHGLLYHWIDADQTLTWAVNASTSMTLREKWASQIKRTLAILHKLGVVRGDAKAENVLIDREGDAVIIDFEGESTRGWVDEGQSGTLDGDLQGLENIMDYIFNDDSVLRPSLESDGEFR